MDFSLIFAAVTGAALSYYLLSKKTGMFKFLAAACGVYLICHFNRFDGFPEGMTFTIGVICVATVFSGMTVFINPLLRGKWLDFKEYYVIRGIVSAANTQTSYGSTTTVTEGVFGNLNAHTQNYHVDHDVFHIKDASGKTHVITGEFIKKKANVGDDVIVGGRTGHRDFVFMNNTRKEQWTTLYASKKKALLEMSLLTIPFLGQFVLSVNFACAPFLRLKGFFSSSPIEFEQLHVGFAVAYNMIAVSLAVWYGVSSHNIGGAFLLYWVLLLPMTLLHASIWQKDYARFDKFLNEKMMATLE
jgi:hypothetical protein